MPSMQSMVESSGSQGGARIPACSSSRWKRKPLQRNIRLHVSGFRAMDFSVPWMEGRGIVGFHLQEKAKYGL
jgi:hypothetical protein